MGRRFCVELVFLDGGYQRAHAAGEGVQVADQHAAFADGPGFIEFDDFDVHGLPMAARGRFGNHADADVGFHHPADRLEAGDLDA